MFVLCLAYFLVGTDPGSEEGESENRLPCDRRWLLFDRYWSKTYLPNIESVWLLLFNMFTTINISPLTFGEAKGWAPFYHGSGLLCFLLNPAMERAVEGPGLLPFPLFLLSPPISKWRGAEEAVQVPHPVWAPPLLVPECEQAHN